jgi:predicted SnoaL-like aldol condensation-catalyzing enzyme
MHSPSLFTKSLSATAGILFVAATLSAATPVAAADPASPPPVGLAKVVDGYGQWDDPRFYDSWMYDKGYLAALAQDPNPRLAANKRLVLGFESTLARTVLEGRVDQDVDSVINHYMSPNYHQMDPNIPDGKSGLSAWLKAGGMHKGGALKGGPPPVAVLADGDSVTMILAMPPTPAPDDPSKSFASYMISVFRVDHGLLSAHYDSSSRGAYWCRIGCGHDGK